MFKNGWEKASVTHHLPQGMIEKMMLSAYPERELLSHELIAGGCANLNYKIHIKNEDHPIILRVYLRDAKAAFIEQKLSALLNKTVPTPQTYHIGKVDDYHFAITEFIYGITLRSLLLGEESYDINSIMSKVGEVLSKISKHEFSYSGFFDKNLNIIPSQFSENYLAYAKECLKDEAVIATLKPSLISEISKIIYKYGHLFPDKDKKHLVHGDFDPANILVNKVNGEWKVSGVLDWEFAFSGSIMYDIANMLRYAHEMPPVFQEAFISGVASGGITLPQNWRITAHLLNLVALLDCLKRSDPIRHINKCADIRRLINHIISELNTLI